MIFASIFPWASVYIYQSSWNTLNLDYFPIALIISEVVYLYGIFKFRIMSTIPIAHNVIFHHAKEGILLLDFNGYIIDENETFSNIFPNYNRKIKTLDAFLSANPDVYKCINKKENSYFHIENENKIGYFSTEIVEITVGNYS